MNRLTCRLKSYIQPFERELALRELALLAKAKPQPLERQLTLREIPSLERTNRLSNSFQERDCLLFSVETDVRPQSLADKLAYWETVSGEVNHNTTQVLREATVNVVRNGIQSHEIQRLVSSNLQSMLPNRRCLRYGTHGLHEYRGKFFPQLVRSLINLSGLPHGAVIADPMCGSGTTAVEAILTGCNAVALDRNPLSTLIARTKCALLGTKPDILISRYEQLRQRLLSPGSRKSGKLAYFKSLAEPDQRYLTAWFSEQVLTDLDSIVQQIDTVRELEIRDMMWVVLSNILRKVSWQKTDDLRVRKEVRLDTELDPIREYLEELGRSTRLLAAFLYQMGSSNLGNFDIREGDTRLLESEFPDLLGKIDVVITSPPYATALPYLDTDRLSLCYLRLLSRPMHRNRDLEMIGNREITDKRRQAYWHDFQKHKNLLPRSIIELVETVERRNSSHNVGFRRKNLPALLAKYFADMKKVFAGVRCLLKPNGIAYFVVGSNHTIAGGKRIQINTPALLADLAKDLGFSVEGALPMEMLISRDIFRKNAGASEEILLLRT